MRSTPWLAIFIVFIFALTTSQQVAAEGRRLVLRDDPPPSRTSASDTASATKEAAASTSDHRAAAAAEPTSASNSSSTAAASSTVASSILPSSTVDTNATNLNMTLYNGTMAPPGVLPLTPDITPAFSVAGVLLILTGVVYCLIGIKNKWMQIFISAAYLTALAITVLIIYVMKPPITNAVQGAYLAAAVVPALLLGTGALIFRDVTEGLGCAIGGFSISMFFLVLKPGGTITSQAGKAIFIGVWTAVTFCLSFSRFTRSYTIIGSSAFGGATAVVLGIDMFSRAGLKEFWVWIWDLNDDLFPLLQATYPITRGIRVEIAGIVVFTFFGVLSQLKIWKVIQARRERKEQERIDANRERDELEAQIGRDVEAGNDRDRGQWEAIYGDKDRALVDSGVGTEAGSTRKGSMSTYAKENGKHADIIELDHLDSPRSPKGLEHGDPMIVRVAAEEPPPPGSVLSGVAAIKGGASSVKSGSQSPAIETAPKAGPSSEVGAEDTPIPTIVVPAKPKKAHTASPKVVPLPFQIPKTGKDDDDVESNATFNDSEHSFKRYSQRFSGLHLMRKPSDRSKRASQISVKTSSSVEALVDNSVGEDSDRRISLSSRSHSPNGDQQHYTPDMVPTTADGKTALDIDGKADNEAKSELDAMFAPVTLAALEGESAASKARKSAEVDGNESDTSEKHAPSVKSKKSTKSRASSVSFKDLKSHLPNDASKVVLQYRTNEWAKHLSNAEQPDVDDIPISEPVVEETATSVNPRALLQTALNAEPKPAPLPPPPNQPKSPKHPAKTPPSSAAPMPERIPSFSLNGTSSPIISPNGSQTSLNDPQASRASLHSQQPRRAGSALRNTSSPLLSTPIDEDAEADFHTPLPTDTLLATRNTMLDRKLMTGSTANLLSRPGTSRSSTPGQLSHMPSSSSLGNSTSQGSLSPPLGPEDDNMSLSARKAALQRSATHSPSIQPLVLPTATLTATNAPAPDLRRSTTDPALRRASMLAAWRQSIAKDVNRGRGAEQEVQMRREEMWRDRQREQEERERRRESEGGWGKDGVRGERRVSRRASRMSGMSGREINDAHREVLRKMQAGANRKLKEGGDQLR